MSPMLFGPLFPDAVPAAETAPPVWEVSFVLPLVVALGGAITVTALWEGIVKRYRDRRDLAAAFATEIETLGQQAALLLPWLQAEPESRLPREYRLATPVFDALSTRIVELRPDELAAILTCYMQVRNLNAFGDAAWAAGAAGDNDAELLASSVRRPRQSWPKRVEMWRPVRAEGLDGASAIMRAWDISRRARLVTTELRRRYPPLPFHRSVYRWSWSHFPGPTYLGKPPRPERPATPRSTTPAAS